MAKFATPVAMKVTEEEGIELIKRLKTLGYRYIHRRYDGYVTTCWRGQHNLVTIRDYKPIHRHIIEEYNPELFLAIAAMTEDEIPIIGEWLSCKSADLLLFRVNSYGNRNNYTIGRINKEDPNGSGYFLKATLEELINHFSETKETFELPKKWKLEVTKENVDAVNKWKKSLGKWTVLVSGNAVEQDGFWGPSINGIGIEYTAITTEQFMEHVYKPAFNTEIPKEFYVKYCEGFTEDIFNQLYDWGKENSEGPIRGFNDKYQSFVSGNLVDRFNFQRKIEKGDYNFKPGYGADNHNWCGRVKTEYTLEQVKNLINYKPKTNKNECKEDSYEREIKEIKQIDEDLDSISSREGGKEIKIRTVSSRNLCQRGSIESSNSITSPRGNSNRIKAERGRLYI